MRQKTVMINNPDNNDLKDIANKVITVVDDIVQGKAMPYEANTKKWATDTMLRLDSLDCKGNLLAEKIEDCLVDILSCDNASWDTTIAAFSDNLDKLKTEN